VLTRRDFLKGTLVATAAGAVVPTVWADAVHAATSDGVHDHRVLVILQLAGGNDGLNTVVPYNDPTYAQLRPTLAIPASQALPLDASVGLHPALTGMKALFDAGKLAVVRGVGYPGFTYSHFEAMRVYGYADPAHRPDGQGWMGRVLAGQIPPTGVLEACAVDETSIPGELRATGADVSVIPSAHGYDFSARHKHAVPASASYRATPGPYGALFDTALATAEQGIAAVKAANGSYHPGASYLAPGAKPNGLATALEFAAELIVTQPTTKLVHVVLGGFDTHTGEKPRHDALMGELDPAVSGFFADLTAHGQSSRVTMLTWSEFGRRVKENGSGGTDHGSAQPLFVIGDGVAGGLVGDQPSLTDLDNGNLRMTTDFRSVYQSVVVDWLGGDASAVLGGAWPVVKLFR
jgi:uncharacterized protein (DUF1501 family)